MPGPPHEQLMMCAPRSAAYAIALYPRRMPAKFGLSDPHLIAMMRQLKPAPATPLPLFVDAEAQPPTTVPCDVPSLIVPPGAGSLSGRRIPCCASAEEMFPTKSQPRTSSIRPFLSSSMLLLGISFGFVQMFAERSSCFQSVPESIIAMTTELAPLVTSQALSTFIRPIHVWVL